MPSSSRLGPAENPSQPLATNFGLGTLAAFRFGDRERVEDREHAGRVVVAQRLPAEAPRGLQVHAEVVEKKSAVCGRPSFARVSS